MNSNMNFKRKTSKLSDNIIKVAILAESYQTGTFVRVE